MSYRVSVVIAQIKLHALPPPCKFETPEEAEARKANVKPKVLAVMVKFSLSHLRRVFKQETSMTIPQFTKDCQLRWASELLVETLLPVVEIAEQVGYEDPSHFSRDFKRTFQITPREHRRKREQKE